MGLLNAMYHEDDRSYGYGNPEEERRYEQEKEEFQAEWQKKHFIRVIFGAQVVECSFLDRSKEEKLWGRISLQADIRADKVSNSERILVYLSTKIVPDGFVDPSVSFDGDHSDVEGCLIWDQDHEYYVPDPQIMKNLKEHAKYIKRKNPIDIDGEIFYFPVKNKRIKHSVYYAEAHVNGQVFPVSRNQSYSILEIIPWRLEGKSDTPRLKPGACP